MEPIQIQSPEDLRRLFDEKQKAIANLAKEIVKREWELMEFNLFMSSLGKEKLNEASNAVKRLRKLEAEGKINLEQYEELAEEF